MRKDTTFSERKLSEKEFSDKYWMHGQFPYQYHTGTIEDGRDEREQFLFNNCRALWERMNREAEERREGVGGNQAVIEELRELVVKQERQIEGMRKAIKWLNKEHERLSSKPAKHGGKFRQESDNGGKPARKLVIEVRDGSTGERDIICCIITRADIKKPFGL